MMSISPVRSPPTVTFLAVFTVVFDTTLETPGSVASFIRGVRNLKINTVPD